MSQVEELLRNLSSGVSVASFDGSEEEHIIIDNDRFITVPESLKRIAVQYDNNIETVTFDCPRYWNGNDLSLMKIFINYLRADKVPGCSEVENITIDEVNGSIIHFTWTIDRYLTMANGNIVFLVCAKNVDKDGNEINHWNSELNKQMYISEGLECHEIIEITYPDILTDILTRIDTFQNNMLPPVTTANNGSTLRVVNGVWTVVPE